MVDAVSWVVKECLVKGVDPRICPSVHKYGCCCGLVGTSGLLEGVVVDKETGVKGSSSSLGKSKRDRYVTVALSPVLGGSLTTVPSRVFVDGLLPNNKAERRRTVGAREEEEAGSSYVTTDFCEAERGLLSQLSPLLVLDPCCGDGSITVRTGGVLWRV